MGRRAETIKKLARIGALDADTVEKILGARGMDGGPGSGNFGHAGRPGKRGGSSKEGGGGAAAGGTGSGSGATNEPTATSSSRPVAYPKGKATKAGGMKEPYSAFGGSSAPKHGSLKRDPKASQDMMKKFQAQCKRQDSDASPNGTEKACQKFLDEMPAGAAFRFDEPSKKKTYDWMVKQPDGSFLYTNKLDGSQTVLDAKTVAHDIATFGEPDKALGDFSVPEKGASQNDAYWSAKRQFAGLKPTPADTYTGTRVGRMESVENCEKRARGELDYPKEEGNASKEYTGVQKDANGATISAGKPYGKLDKGSGVTGIDPGDISQKNPDKLIYNTLGEQCVRDANGNLVLTPEREALHEEIVGNIFEKAQKPADGKKVATFLGGGSAAGKGTIQDSGYVDFPSREISPVIDADAIKESLPEYVDTAFSDDHEQAASFAHEESSSLAKRAIQAAHANGYNYTLDGTGDGSIKSMKKKIDEARANGYEVNGVYVTCPTEKAVERSIGRSKTDKYGRLVQPETVRDIHAKVSQLFPEIAPLMDNCDLYDTDQGGKPVKIATCKRGGPIQVLNQKLYDAFLAKAKENAAG